MSTQTADRPPSEPTGGAAPATSSAGRILSLDQFRGYTVAGMFVVNFCGGLEAIPRWLKHNNVYFSYADSIMPSFLFICGVSYRLTMVKRMEREGGVPARKVAMRSLGLVLVSLGMYGFSQSFDSWSEMTRSGWWGFFANLLKADLWEVLAIIGVVQVLLLPVIGASWRVRLAALIGCSVLHLMLSHVFNYWFVYGKPNLLDPYWGAAGRRAWDGGFFGLIHWSFPMLAGTLAYDIWRGVGGRPVAAAGRLMVWGLLLMGLGYGLSGLSRAYDTDKGLARPAAFARPGGEAEKAAADDRKYAYSPVLPPVSIETFQRFPLSSWLAEPPMVPPPPPDQRLMNYWLMDKRIVSIPFIWFATGCALSLYAIFLVVCDVGRWQIGVFRTLGQNPLAAYVIHHAIEVAVLAAFVPKDSPLWWCLIGLAIFFGWTYAFVRFLERQGIYLRL